MLGIHYIASVAEIVPLSLTVILNFLDEPEVEDGTIRSDEACQAPLTTLKNLLLSEAERLYLGTPKKNLLSSTLCTGENADARTYIPAILINTPLPKNARWTSSTLAHSKLLTSSFL